jgi:hypothetical protein
MFRPTAEDEQPVELDERDQECVRASKCLFTVLTLCPPK